MKKFMVVFVFVVLFIGCASLGSLLESGGNSGSGGQNSGGGSAASGALRVKTPRPAPEQNDPSKTDAELVAEAIKWGDCAFLYAYTQKDGADKQLVSQANAAIKRYSDLDGGTGKYRTGKMDARVRQVSKELMKKVFLEPEAALPDVTASLVKGLSDQFAKAKVLHDWICDNIAYDAEMYLSGRTTAQDYVSVLKKKKAVCSGYTNLMNRMCELASIESIGINGYSKGFGYAGKIGRNTDHAWNAVHIGNKWYLIDVTWDAGPVERRTFIKRYSTEWLFLDSRPFLYSHLPEEEACQYYAPVLTADDFMREAYIAGNFFQYGLALKEDDPEYNNSVDGGFTFDIGLRNSNVSLSSELRTANQQNINAASWATRTGNAVTFDFDVPDTNTYKGYIFARYNNEVRLQDKVGIGTYEGDWLPRAEALFVKDKPKESKITEKELEYFRASYYKVQENGSYYFLEDQFDTARNNAVLKIHQLLELSTMYFDNVLDFNITSAPGYAGFGNGVVKYPYTFASYNQAPNTQLLSPLKGVLKAGTTELFSVSSKDYTKIGVWINGSMSGELAKNSKTGNFELSLAIPADITELNIFGSKNGRNYTGLLRFNIVP
jgi:hypothetical protein